MPQTHVQHKYERGPSSSLAFATFPCLILSSPLCFQNHHRNQSPVSCWFSNESPACANSGGPGCFSSQCSRWGKAKAVVGGEAGSVASGGGSSQFDERTLRGACCWHNEAAGAAVPRRFQFSTPTVLLPPRRSSLTIEPFVPLVLRRILLVLWDRGEHLRNGKEDVICSIGRRQSINKSVLEWNKIVKNFGVVLLPACVYFILRNYIISVLGFSVAFICNLWFLPVQKSPCKL